MSQRGYTHTPDFLVDISRGVHTGYSSVNKFGRNPDVDTSTDPEDCWDGGGLYVPPTAARIHDLASTDANDAAAGTGARTVKVYGLNADWQPISETVTLNGASNVATVNSYARMFRARCVTAGSGGVNAGTITATAQTDSTVSAQITAGLGQTLQSIYSVPANKSAYILGYYGSLFETAGSGGGVLLQLFVREGADQADACIQLKHAIGIKDDGSNPHAHHFQVPVLVREKSDIILRIGEVTANNSEVFGGFELMETT